MGRQTLPQHGSQLGLRVRRKQQLLRGLHLYANCRPVTLCVTAPRPPGELELLDSVCLLLVQPAIALAPKGQSCTLAAERSGRCRSVRSYVLLIPTIASLLRFCPANLTKSISTCTHP